ncbi:VTC domain-containing protein [Methanogenium marinum]|uniref:VTC domain-containing protein n=1 Tax=Methanogenium marinum TaxID=348610 RepID=A0A9Q4KSF2_9EURY|nr:VTC domain-containing protein [Methanogenium marinum]MDE4907724.1 VTC domain-containing protein [Methanogenium marinum]
MIQNLLQISDFRYERKSFISSLSRHEIEAFVKSHPAMFIEAYSPRYVNNIYLDTPNMDHYFANVDGISNRLKVRIRWYGNLFGLVEKPVMELKIKKGMLGGKRNYPLPSFTLNQELSRTDMRESLEGASLPENLNEYVKSLNFALLNRYYRKYLVSADTKFRITLDNNLEYYCIHPNNNYFSNKMVDTENMVFELKYNEKEDNAAENIMNQFPLRITKNSKYVSGIDEMAF